VNGPNTTVEVGGSVSATPPRWLHPIRRTVHRLPAGPLIWKIGIAAIGAAIVLVGLLLIPLPGPGWALVFLGVGVWATEFGWARRLLVRGREILKASRWPCSPDCCGSGGTSCSDAAPGGEACLGGRRAVVWRRVRCCRPSAAGPRDRASASARSGTCDRGRRPGR
jgi:uncharacterized protein (TIGR02611 family)